MSTELSVIIVNWKSKTYLRKCLESLDQHTRGIEFEVIVADNASFDGCGEMLAAEFPKVRFIQCEKNLGFSGANNLAAKSAAGRALLFLNPDTVLLRPALEILYKSQILLAACGAVGARLLNTDLTLQNSCVQSFPTALNQLLDSEATRRLFPRSSLWGMAALYETDGAPREVEGISGACLMIRAAVFHEVGGFDVRYFMYAEDFDLCFKIHQAGYKIYYVPQAELVHHGGGSSKRARNAFSSVQMRKAVCQFLGFRRGRLSADLFRAGLLVSSVVRLMCIGAVALLKGQRLDVSNPVINKWFAILRWSIGLDGWSRAAELRRKSTQVGSTTPF